MCECEEEKSSHKKYGSKKEEALLRKILVGTMGYFRIGVDWVIFWNINLLSIAQKKGVDEGEEVAMVGLGTANCH